MVLGPHLPEVDNVDAVDPVIQGQSQVDGEVDRVKAPVLEPILGQRPPMSGPIRHEPPHRRLLRRVLVHVAIFLDGRARRCRVLADEDVHGRVLERRDASRFREDVDVD